MSKELQDFIDDWQVNVKEKSATHKSGLQIGYDATNDDGSLQLAYSGMTTFLKNTYAELQSAEAVENRRAELTEEFVAIFNAKMTPQFSKIPLKPTSREY